MNVPTIPQLIRRHRIGWQAAARLAGELSPEPAPHPDPMMENTSRHTPTVGREYGVAQAVTFGLAGAVMRRRAWPKGARLVFIGDYPEKTWPSNQLGVIHLDCTDVQAEDWIAL